MLVLGENLRGIGDIVRDHAMRGLSCGFALQDRDTWTEDCFGAINVGGRNRAVGNLVVGDNRFEVFGAGVSYGSLEVSSFLGLEYL